MIELADDADVGADDDATGAEAATDADIAEVDEVAGSSNKWSIFSDGFSVRFGAFELVPFQPQQKIVEMILDSRRKRTHQTINKRLCSASSSSLQVLGISS